MKVFLPATIGAQLLFAAIAGAGHLEERQGQSVLTLAQAAIQSASQETGNNGSDPNQSNSLTDSANFINFCLAKALQLTNGTQSPNASCNGIPMGQLPAYNKMISQIIINPRHNENIATPNTDFTVDLAIVNMATGNYTNLNTTYMSAPQQLDPQGLIYGHTHITIENLGNSFNPTVPLDPTKFVFFRAVNGVAQKTFLSVPITGGLPAGFYRVCTLASTANHQSVLMPASHRGAQDDCTKFSVGQKQTVLPSNSTSASTTTSSTSSGDRLFSIPIAAPAIALFVQAAFPL